MKMKFKYNKGNHKQSNQTCAHRTGEDLSQLFFSQEANMQNLQKMQKLFTRLNKESEI